mmetsp:Transcript_6074/g.17780  ORF Transcript_6074/g.17780 Transcript_6074/m.17780 type:complete len:95 (-) Transcript_6074:698-982(-)
MIQACMLIMKRPPHVLIDVISRSDEEYEVSLSKVSSLGSIEQEGWWYSGLFLACMHRDDDFILNLFLAGSRQPTSNCAEIQFFRNDACLGFAQE